MGATHRALLMAGSLASSRDHFQHYSNPNTARVPHRMGTDKRDQAIGRQALGCPEGEMTIVGSVSKEVLEL